jgi:hypothetical protein
MLQQQCRYAAAPTIRHALRIEPPDLLHYVSHHTGCSHQLGQHRGLVLYQGLRARGHSSSSSSAAVSDKLRGPLADKIVISVVPAGDWLLGQLFLWMT